jgi:phage terminase large subunit-like protein
MVETARRVIDPNVAFAAVRASPDKVTRAEPVAALYEQGRVHHIGTFPQLEDQMCSFVPSRHGNVALRSARYSPDWVDALVWALTTSWSRRSRIWESSTSIASSLRRPAPSSSLKACRRRS